MFRDATYKLPEGHKSVAACISLDDARNAAKQLMGRREGAGYYIMDKRGAWEVIEYPTTL